jgi:hypothetical protein
MQNCVLVTCAFEPLAQHTTGVVPQCACMRLNNERTASGCRDLQNITMQNMGMPSSDHEPRCGVSACGCFVALRSTEAQHNPVYTTPPAAGEQTLDLDHAAWWCCPPSRKWPSQHPTHRHQQVAAVGRQTHAIAQSSPAGQPRGWRTHARCWVRRHFSCASLHLDHQQINRASSGVPATSMRQVTPTHQPCNCLMAADNQAQQLYVAL